MVCQHEFSGETCWLFNCKGKKCVKCNVCEATLVGVPPENLPVDPESFPKLEYVEFPATPVYDPSDCNGKFKGTDGTGNHSGGGYNVDYFTVCENHIAAYKDANENGSMIVKYKIGPWDGSQHSPKNGYKFNMKSTIPKKKPIKLAEFQYGFGRKFGTSGQDTVLARIKDLLECGRQVVAEAEAGKTPSKQTLLEFDTSLKNLREEG